VGSALRADPTSPINIVMLVISDPPTGRGKFIPKKNICLAMVANLNDVERSTSFFPHPRPLSNWRGELFCGAEGFFSKRSELFWAKK
jgi:hypothetical protein